jgi:tRNA threonylcarbamoyladenosine biosynthesis protein TsaB
MNHILHLETSTKNCSVCLSRDGKPWIVQQIQDPSGHAANLTLFIQKVLQTADLELKDIDAVAVSQGPGSYTGLRIGVSTAKGLCYTLDKPMLAVDTLQSLAMAIPKDNHKKTAYVGMLDARRMDAYVGIYDKEGSIIEQPYFCTLSSTSFEHLLEQGYDQVYLAGDATSKYAPLLTNKAIQISAIELPSASYLCPLAFAQYQNNTLIDTAYFEPFYLKKPHITKAKPRF